MLKSVASVALLGAVLLGACGGDDADNADRDRIVSFLLEQGESQEAAECFADELSEFSIEEFEALVDAEGPEDVDPDFSEAIDRAQEEACVDL